MTPGGSSSAVAGSGGDDDRTPPSFVPFGGNVQPPPLPRGGHSAFVAQSTAQFKLRMKDPPIFKRDVNSDVYTWLLTVEDYLRVTGSSDQECVAYIITLLTDVAKEWWHTYFSTRHHILPPYAEFCRALKERFGSDMREQRARNALHNITIRSGENCRQYSSRFQAELQRIPMYDSHWAFDTYVQGLPDKAREAIIMAGIRDLNAAIRKAE